MPKTRSPGPSAVAHQQDETKPAEASPPHAHEVRGRREAAPHARGSLRGLRREAARPPSPAPPGQGPARPGGARRPLRSHGLSRSGAAPRERRGRYSHIQARATARLGHRPAAGSPSGGSDPAASPDPRSPPDRRRGTRLRRRWRVPLLPPGRPTSPLPAGARRPAAGQEQRRAAAAALPGRERKGKEGKGRGRGRARPRHPGAALHTAGCPRRRSCSCPGDVAVRADALITGRQAAAAAATAAAAGRGRPREGRAPRGRGGRAAPPSWWWQQGGWRCDRRGCPGSSFLLFFKPPANRFIPRRNIDSWKVLLPLPPSAEVRCRCHNWRRPGPPEYVRRYAQVLGTASGTERPGEERAVGKGHRVVSAIATKQQQIIKGWQRLTRYQPKDFLSSAQQVTSGPACRRQPEAGELYW
ncbi:uncharacterized protein LOC142414820 [Mycteria americana]|uniref:uncharacterized protein LOC142414820 n=1 Tax=Mycteria americana TaxID=33587 RepID=UPI003F581F5E